MRKALLLLFSGEGAVDVQAVKRQGMTISEIARRSDRGCRAIRAYLAGDRAPRGRQRGEPGPFEKFVDNVTARQTEDPHLWAVTLLDELLPLGFLEVLSDVDTAGSGPGVAPGVPGLPACDETAECDHRASGRGGDTVRLGRAARRLTRVDFPEETSLRARRVAGSLRGLAGRDLPLDGPARPSAACVEFRSRRWRHRPTGPPPPIPYRAQ